MTSSDPLAPLRQALFDQAAAAADRVRADAERAAHEVVAAAAERGDALLAEARATGEEEAGAAFANDRARNRAAARGVILAAQRRVYEQLRSQARVGVRELLSDPEVHARLVAAVRARVGEPAEVVDLPDGGVVGRSAAGRTVDASVDTLVEQALAGLDLGQLWAPH